jgi:F-type H+-transporting ATPase subunit delta
MSSAQIARRYSKALLALCEGEASQEAVATDLDRMLEALAVHAELATTLYGRGLEISSRRRILEPVMKSLSLGALASKFLLYLNEQKRFDVLPEIVACFHQQLDELAGRVRATVVSAKALSEAETKKIESALAKASGKKVLLDTLVDPTLIGGVVTRIGNVVLDGSVRTALNQVKMQLAEAVQ